MVRLALLALLVVLLQVALGQPSAIRTVFIESGLDFVRSLADPTVGTLVLPPACRVRVSDFSEFDDVIVVTRNYTMRGLSATRCVFVLLAAQASSPSRPD